MTPGIRRLQSMLITLRYIRLVHGRKTKVKGKNEMVPVGLAIVKTEQAIRKLTHMQILDRKPDPRHPLDSTQKGDPRP